jgi:S-adenosylmethionine:tRNA ribosyltransferase-isomerase
MQLAEFDFPFDPSLVAVRPADPRDAARLMVVSRGDGACSHRQMSDLPALLRAHDVLVVNDTRVLPARVVGHKRPGGGKVELLFVKEREEGVWQVLVDRNVKSGQVIAVDDETTLTVLHNGAETLTRVSGRRTLRVLLEEKGQMPLPPYIKRAPVEEDRIWYQTVFAKQAGAIAAPTAGLHFSDQLLATLRHSGVTIVSVTLHIGPGTFLPVRTLDIHQHKMLGEAFHVPPETVEAVQRGRSVGGRVVAVGTTVVRALEAAVGPDQTLTATEGETKLFITPGFRFRVVDGLLTNFHLPRSTLLMLVSALTGLERMREAYTEAMNQRYRLYSYGDAMLIL